MSMNRFALKTMPESDRLAIDAYINSYGVTKCPTAYLMPIAGAEPLPSVPNYDDGLEKVSGRDQMRAKLKADYDEYLAKQKRRKIKRRRKRRLEVKVSKRTRTHLKKRVHLADFL